MDWVRSLWRAAASAVAFSACVASAQPSLSDGALVHPGFRGPVPQRSDVIFSTRFKRDDSVAVARAFGATRIEWVYTSDTGFVAALKGVAPWFGGTLNANAPLPNDAGYARDFDDKPLVAPWMKSWGAKWVTTNHPDTLRVMGEQLARYLQLGVSSVQFDDPLLQAYSAEFQAGDFNAATQAGFKEWVKQHPNKTLLRSIGLLDYEGDYRAYLKERHNVVDAADYRRRFRSFPSTPIWLTYVRSTVEAYFGQVRRQLAQRTPNRVALSMNLWLPEPDASHHSYFLSQYPDYMITETDIGATPEMIIRAATARSHAMGLVPSIKPKDLARNRVAIATFYALGAPPLVPWDLFAGEGPRYLGTVAEFGDLYSFARQQRSLLDGYESTALVGVAVAVDKYRAERTRALARALIDRQIPFAFIPIGGPTQLRADPQKLKHFRLIIRTNDEADFPSEDRRMLQEARAVDGSRAGAAEVALAELQPFVIAPGAERVRMYPSAVPGEKSRLVVHVVDEGRGAPNASTDEGCRHRVGIRNTVLGPQPLRSARWITPWGARNVTPEQQRDLVFMSLPGCPAWGLLELRLAQ